MIVNRKGIMLISFFVFIIGMCGCSKMTKTEENLPDYVNFGQLIEGYGVEDAVNDDCVVFVDSRLISGEDIWMSFMEKTEKKQSCRVRIAVNYSTESLFYLIDLSYEDSSFCVNTSEGLFKEYKYMNHYEIDMKNSDSDDSIIDCYLLTNQESVTYDEIEKSMASAILGDAIDHYIVYYNVF